MTFWLFTYEDVAFCIQKQATQVLQRYVCSLGWSVTKTKVSIDYQWKPLMNVKHSMATVPGLPCCGCFNVEGEGHVWDTIHLLLLQWYDCHVEVGSSTAGMHLDICSCWCRRLVRKSNLFAPCSDPDANNSLCPLSVMVQSHSYQVGLARRTWWAPPHI